MVERREQESYWQEFQSSAQDDFGSYLGGNNKQVTDSLMNVADRNADQINNAALSPRPTPRFQS